MTEEHKKLVDKFISILEEADSQAYGTPLVCMHPSHIYTDMYEEACFEQEHCWALFLDSTNKVMKKYLVSKGTVNLSLVHPRETFREAIKANTSSIIVVHNHPSGNTTPSKEDIGTAKRLQKCGLLLGIKLLDFMIISKKGYVSFLETGELERITEDKSWEIERL